MGEVPALGMVPSAARRLGDLWRRAATGPLPSVVGAVLLMGVLIAIIAPDPGAAVDALVTGSLTGRGLAESLQRSVPLIGLAVAYAYALRAGVLNIGGEGQMVMGALAATVVALYVPGPALIVVPAAYLAAALVGGLWAALAGVMFTRLALPIMITSLLLNYPADSIASYLVRFPLKDPTSSMIATPMVPNAFDIPPIAAVGSVVDVRLASLFGVDSPILLVTRNVNVSVVFVLALVVAVAFVNSRTRAGYETGMLGRNARFASYGGVNTRTTTLRTMVVSGAICGVVGATIVFGSQYRLIDGAIVQTNYAWTALLVALLAGSGSIALLVTGFAFAAILAGGAALERSTGVSAQLANVTQAAIILLVSIRLALPTSWGRRSRSSGTPTEAEPVP